MEYGLFSGGRRTGGFYLYANVRGQGIYESADGAGSWSPMPMPGSQSPGTLALAASNPGADPDMYAVQFGADGTLLTCVTPPEQEFIPTAETLHPEEECVLKLIRKRAGDLLALVYTVGHVRESIRSSSGLTRPTPLGMSTTSSPCISLRSTSVSAIRSIWGRLETISEYAVT